MPLADGLPMPVPIPTKAAYGIRPAGAAFVEAARFDVTCPIESGQHAFDSDTNLHAAPCATTVKLHESR
jgi:hypothetical protein